MVRELFVDYGVGGLIGVIASIPICASYVRTSFMSDDSTFFKTIKVAGGSLAVITSALLLHQMAFKSAPEWSHSVVDLREV